MTDLKVTVKGPSHDSGFEGFGIGYGSRESWRDLGFLVFCRGAVLVRGSESRGLWVFRFWGSGFQSGWNDFQSF